MVKIVGKYKVESSKNCDEYAKALGVDMKLCKMANKAVSSEEITLNGDTYTLKTIYDNLKTVELKFKLGKEFEETTVDGRVVKTTFVLEGNKLIQNQVGEKDYSATRVFTDTGMVLEGKGYGIFVKLIFKRQA